VQNLPVCTTARLDTNKSSLKIDTDVQTLLESALSIYGIKSDVLEQLQPTHIITQDQCDVCAVSFADVERAVAQLTQSNPQVISLQPNKLADVWADIERVAQVLGVDEKPILSQLQSRIDFCRDRIQFRSAQSLRSPSRLRRLTAEYLGPTVAAIEWTDPIMASGNWIPELIELAGGKNLFGTVGQHSPYLQWQDIVEADPDCIIIMPCGFDLERTRRESQTLTQHPDWTNLQAVKSGKVFITDGNAYFNRPGPRLVDSLEILAEIIHPELFDFDYRGTGWEVYA
jgi:iron complex transport system substrate-binding protein